MALKSDMVMK